MLGLLCLRGLGGSPRVRGATDACQPVHRPLWMVGGKGRESLGSEPVQSLLLVVRLPPAWFRSGGAELVPVRLPFPLRVVPDGSGVGEPAL